MADMDFVRALPGLTDRASRRLPFEAYPTALQEIFPVSDFAAARAEIADWPGYAESPLRALTELAAALKIGSVSYKDESSRFALGSFKALGGAYAVLRLLADLLSDELGEEISPAAIRAGKYRERLAGYRVTSATDGNHGRSVAWGAKMAGCACRIYIHAGVSAQREAALADLGAEVIRTRGDYDQSVHQCAEEAAANGWYVVSDTSYPGYDRVPRFVMAGYGVMAGEILAETAGRPPTHVFLQAGVGGMAAAVAARIWSELNEQRPRFVIVEADRAACILKSVREERPAAVKVTEETIMAGLSCGEISLLAWEVLNRCADHVVTVSDGGVTPTMRELASGRLGGGAIEGGECSTTGLLALAAIARDPALREEFALSEDSRVLVIGTEGATDPDFYRAALAGEV